MSKQYDDSRYGVEKVMWLPLVTLAAGDGASKNYLQFTVTENMTVTELGFRITTTLSGNAAGSFTITESAGGSVVATLTFTSGQAAAVIPIKQTTMTSANALSNGSVMNFNMLLPISAGAGYPYIKYTERP